MCILSLKLCFTLNHNIPEGAWYSWSGHFLQFLNSVSTKHKVIYVYVEKLTEK